MGRGGKEKGGDTKDLNYLTINHRIININSKNSNTNKQIKLSSLNLPFLIEIHLTKR